MSTKRWHYSKKAKVADEISTQRQYLKKVKVADEKEHEYGHYTPVGGLGIQEKLIMHLLQAQLVEEDMQEIEHYSCCE